MIRVWTHRLPSSWRRSSILSVDFCTKGTLLIRQQTGTVHKLVVETSGYFVKLMSFAHSEKTGCHLFGMSELRSTSDRLATLLTIISLLRFAPVTNEYTASIHTLPPPLVPSSIINILERPICFCSQMTLIGTRGPQRCVHMGQSCSRSYSFRGNGRPKFHFRYERITTLYHRYNGISESEERTCFWHNRRTSLRTLPSPSRDSYAFISGSDSLQQPARISVNRTCRPVACCDHSLLICDRASTSSDSPTTRDGQVLPVSMMASGLLTISRLLGLATQYSSLLQHHLSDHI